MLVRSHCSISNLVESLWTAYIDAPLQTVLNTQPTTSLDQQADLLERLSLNDRAEPPQAEMNAFKPHFSVYVAPAFTSYGERQGERRKTADIFLGIKPNNVPAGPGEGQDRWLWSKSDSHVFAEDSEFWGKFHVARSVRPALTFESFVAEASLPPIADLLLNPAIQEQDCFTLVLRLQTPATYASALNGVEKRLVDRCVPRPKATIISDRTLLSCRNLLLGLESLLDDVNTGDIRLVCLEREQRSSPPSSRDPGLLSMAEQSSRNSRYRKRVLYAHTSIMKHRSEYLDDWIRFSSSAEQGLSSRNNSTWLDRATHSVTCLDVDFVTMYWLLHFLYTGELEFKNDEDVTNTPAFHIESLDPDVAQKLASDSAEGSSWDWRSLASVDGTVNVGYNQNETPAGKRSSSRPSVSTSPQQVVPSASASNTVAHGKTSRTPTDGRFTSKMNEASSRTPRPSSVSSHATLQVASQLARTLSSPTTSKQATTTRAPPTMDPHDHPTGPLPPASAFAIYALAHRYQLDELARLAQNHLLARLKPASACSLLLASFRFQTLHSAVEDYVISHWEEVQYSVRMPVLLFDSPLRS